MTVPTLDPGDLAEIEALTERWRADAKILAGLAPKCGPWRFVVLSAISEVEHYQRRLSNIARLSSGADPRPAA